MPRGRGAVGRGQDAAVARHRRPRSGAGAGVPRRRRAQRDAGIEWRRHVRYCAAEPAWWTETPRGAFPHDIDPARLDRLMQSLGLESAAARPPGRAAVDRRAPALALVRALIDEPTRAAARRADRRARAATRRSSRSSSVSRCCRGAASCSSATTMRRSSASRTRACCCQSARCTERRAESARHELRASDAARPRACGRAAASSTAAISWVFRCGSSGASPSPRCAWWCSWR